MEIIIIIFRSLPNENRPNENKECRVCNNPIEEFMTFGQMPIANDFMKEKDNEYFFEMAPAFVINVLPFN